MRPTTLCALLVSGLSSLLSAQTEKPPDDSAFTVPSETRGGVFAGSFSDLSRARDPHHDVV